MIHVHISRRQLNRRGLRICFCHPKGVPVLWNPMILFWGDRGPGTRNGMRWCMGIMHDAIFHMLSVGQLTSISLELGLQTPSPWAEGRRSVLDFLLFSRKFHKILHVTVNYQYSVNHIKFSLNRMTVLYRKKHILVSTFRFSFNRMATSTAVLYQKKLDILFHSLALPEQWAY